LPMGQKKLGLFDLTMIVVSLTIGMGIFRTPVVDAYKAGTPTLFFLAWFIGGLVALCGALTYAEIGSRYPVTGGYYRIFSYAYHPSLAFAINCIILVSNAGSTALVAVIGAEYIGRFFFDGPPPALFKQGVTMGAVAVFYIVNLLGIKMSSRVQNALILIKISLIVLLLLSVFGNYPIGTTGAPVAASVPSSLGGMLKALAIGLIAVSFTYGGYQQTINFGGDVKDPARIMPKGITYGICIILLLYLSINFVYVKVIGFESLKDADSIAALLIKHLFGPVGESILRVLMFLSVLAYVNVLLMSNPRVMYAMSKDGILPAAFKKKDEKKDVLTVSLTAFAAIGIIVLFFAKTFDEILSFTIFLDSIGMASSAATIFILRKRTKHLDGTGIYKMKLYPILPLIFIAAYIFVGTSIAFNTPRLALIGTLVFAAFLLIYFCIIYFKKKTA